MTGEVNFAADIKPLFRPTDVESMSWAFDLGSYEGVAANADLILERLRSGTMPCDGAWPPERIAVFEHWIQSNKQP